MPCFSRKARLLLGDSRVLVAARRPFTVRLTVPSSYSQPRFGNREKPEGLPAPSIQHKLGSHLKLIGKVKGIPPISGTITRVAAFDMEKIINPGVAGTGYRMVTSRVSGMSGNVLYRGRTCQNAVESRRIRFRAFTTSKAVRLAKAGRALQGLPRDGACREAGFAGKAGPELSCRWSAGG